MSNKIVLTKNTANPYCTVARKNGSIKNPRHNSQFNGEYMKNHNKSLARNMNVYDDDEIVQDTKVIRPYRVEMQVHGTITVINCDTKSDAKERAKCFIRAFDDTPFDASAIVSRNVPNSVSGNSDPEKLCTFVNVFRQEVYE